MKIIEQSASRMVLRQKPQASLVLFLLVWVGIFSGAPLLILSTVVAKAGVTQLTCRRVQSGQLSTVQLSTGQLSTGQPSVGQSSPQVECEFSQSRFFDLVAGSKTIVPQVTAAQLKTETFSDSEGDYETYQLILNSPQGDFNVTNASSDYLTTQDWYIQLNQMLQSDQPELSLTKDTRWDGTTTIAPTLFLGLFVVVGISVLYGTFRVKTLILDKALNRLTYKVSTLLGTRRLDLPLGTVTEIKVKEHVDGYGNKYYEPILLPDAVRRVTFTHIRDRQEALQIQQQIQQFLNLSLQPSELSEPDADANYVYQNQNRNYSSSGLTEIPATASAKVREMDRNLTRLGFMFVGDLKATHFSNIVFYAYVQPTKDIYAGIMASETNADFAALDFCTSYLDGTILTTTSNKLLIKHLKTQKIRRWAHPGLEVAQLYQHHQQHLIELQAQTGRPHRAKADLFTIAALIDDCFARQTASVFSVMALLINAISISTQKTSAKKSA